MTTIRVIHKCIELFNQNFLLETLAEKDICVILQENCVYQVFPSQPTQPLWNATISALLSLDCSYIGLMTYIDVTNQFIATNMALQELMLTCTCCMAQTFSQFEQLASILGYVCYLPYTRSTASHYFGPNLLNNFSGILPKYT